MQKIANLKAQSIESFKTTQRYINKKFDKLKNVNKLKRRKDITKDFFAKNFYVIEKNTLLKNKLIDNKLTILNVTKMLKIVRKIATNYV